jgi:hypothetical protein
MNHTSVLAKIAAAALDSELIRAVRSVLVDGGLALALGDETVRALRPPEVAELERGGNTAEDWSQIRVAEGFDPSTVRHCSFHGEVILGRFGAKIEVGPGLGMASGLYYSTLADCVIGHDALVRDVRLLGRYVVGPRALLLNCGSVVGEGHTSFGTGQAIPLALESAGREVAIFAEIDVDGAAIVALSRSAHGFLARYTRSVADYAARATSARGIIEAGAVLRDTPRVRNAYLGPGARVEGATLLSDSTLLSTTDDPAHVGSGACVTASLLQWGSGVDTLAVVHRSVLTEHSHVECHAKVTNSLLGPNTTIGAGEVTSSLVGPFVGFHHQALLIAALWPEGRGNVAYGANAGSNHTSRAPDQEFRPGEGAFLGLGVNIKFPTDLSRAPYTVLAPGITTLPQRVAFPFSLINTPTSVCPGVPPAYNEIIPAWMLTDNLFALLRNQKKYQARNRARRSEFDFDVFRPDIVDLMRDACRRLEAVPASREAYTDRQIDGLGKNFLRESARGQALTAYRFFIKYYALLGLQEQLRRARQDGQPGTVAALVNQASDRPRWEHQRQLLLGDLGLTSVTAALGQLPGMLEQVAAAVESSRAKDDARGPAIIPDYADVHAVASDDTWVRQTWAETRRLQEETHELLAWLNEDRVQRVEMAAAHTPEMAPQLAPAAG